MALKYIKWRPEDEKTLREAVKQHNKIVDKVKNDSLGTLEKASYEELRSSILTRKGFNETVARLKRLNEDNATTIVTTNEGLRVTKYDFQEARYAERRYKNRLKKDYGTIQKPVREINRDRQMKALENDFKRGDIARAEFEKRALEIEKEYQESNVTKSPEYMGWSEARRIKENLERDNIERLMNARDTTRFNEIYQGLMTKSSEDYRMAQTIRYKEHYMKFMEDNWINFENYDLLKDKVSSMSPQEFFEFMNQNELTVELNYQSVQTYGQEEFDSYLRDLHILPKETGKEETVEAKQV